MAKKNINIGQSVNDKTGDTLRSAFDKINQNFTELYNATGGGLDLLNVASHIVPATDITYDLGSSTKRFRHVYVGPGSIYIDNARLSLVGGKIQSSVGFALTDTELDAALPSQTGNAGKFLTTDGTHTLSWAVASGGTTDYNNLTNKPALFSGSYTDLTNKPTIPAAQIQSDWNVTDNTLKSYIANKPTIPASATWPVTNTAGASGPTRIAIGNSAGDIAQGNATVAVGSYAGNDTQGGAAVAIGTYAGTTTQRNDAIAIGYLTGNDVQGTGAVSIGRQAGQTNQGAYSIAIGKLAGQTNQAANTIILNALNAPLNGVSAQTNSFYVNPIRTDATPGNILFYNTTTKEITYGAAGSVSSLVNGSKTVSLASTGILTLPAPLAQLINASQLATDTAKIYRATNSTDLAAIATAWDTWYGHEWVFRTYVQEDESVRGSNFPWHGMPSWEAYPLIMNWNSQGGPGLPLNPSMAPAAKTAQDSYLAYKQLVSSIDIVNGNKTISFNNSGLLSLPGKLEFKDTANAKIILKTIDPFGYVVEDSEQDKTWTFNANGTTIFPTNISINYSGGNVQFPRIIADSGKAFSVQGQGASGSAALAWTVDPDAAGQYAQIGVTKNGGDNLAKVILTAQSDSSDAGTAKTWKFDQDGNLTLPSGNSSIQSVQNGNYQSKVTVSPFQILSQARTSQAQSYTVAGEDFTSASGDGAGIITFVSPTGSLTEFLIDTMENGGVYDRTVRLNEAGPEYEYLYFNGANIIVLNTYPAAGAVTAIRFSYTRISKIDISPDNGVFNIQSESGQDIDIQSGRDLDIVATDHAYMISGTNMRLQAGNGNVQISTNYGVPNATQRDWTFNTDGTTQLPLGGVISEGGGLTGAIKLKPAGGANAYQALMIYPTAGGDGDHIHLTAGGGTTELYLGNDLQYVKLLNGGNIEVRATTTNQSASSAWGFGTDGAVSTTKPLIINVPNGVPTGVGAIASTTGSWEQNPLSNLATTGGSGSGLRVNVTYTGGYASAIAIATAGTGYLDGELITVTSGSSSASFIIAVTGTINWTFGTSGKLTLPSVGKISNGAYDWIFSSTGALTLPNSAIIRQSTNTEVTSAFVAYTAAIASWESTRINDYLYSINNNPNLSLAGWAFAGWDDVSGTTASAYLAIVNNAQTIQNSAPSSPPTPLVFTPALSNSLYTQIRAGLLSVINTYAAWQALLTSVDIVAGSETLSLLSNNKIQMPGIIQTDVEEDITIRTRYAVPASPSGTTTANKDFIFGTNGSLTAPGNLQVNGGKIILNTGGNAYVESVDYGVNSANSALNIFGGPYQKINLRAGFGTQATWTLATDGTLTVPGSIIGTATQNVFNTTSTTVNAFGAATTLNIGAAGGTTTIAGNLTASQITIVNNRISTTVNDANLELMPNGVGRVVINAIEDATTSSTTRSVGYLGIPSTNSSISRTLTIADSGKHSYITSAGVTVTIPAASSVAYPVGTTLTFIAGPSATSVSIAITTDTMYLAGTGTTGTRTLAAHGMATAVKVSGTSSAGVWYINGTGLT